MLNGLNSYIYVYSTQVSADPAWAFQVLTAMSNNILHLYAALLEAQLVVANTQTTQEGEASAAAAVEPAAEVEEAEAERQREDEAIDNFMREVEEAAAAREDAQRPQIQLKQDHEISNFEQLKQLNNSTLYLN